MFHRPLPYLYLGAAGADRRAHAVSGVRRAAAGGRAVRGAARPRAGRRAHRRHARGGDRRCCGRRCVQFRSSTACRVAPRTWRALDVALAERRVDRRGRHATSAEVDASSGRDVAAGRASIPIGRCERRRVAARDSRRAGCRSATARRASGAGRVASRRFLRRHERDARCRRGWRRSRTCARARPCSACSTSWPTPFGATTTAARRTRTSRRRFITRSKRGRSRRDADGGRASGGCGGRAIRRVRSRAPRRPGRDRLARAAASQHLLHERAAQGARLAAGDRSDARAAGGVPRSAGSGGANDDAARLPARRRRDRRAVAAGRRRARACRDVEFASVEPPRRTVAAIFADEIADRSTFRRRPDLPDGACEWLALRRGGRRSTTRRVSRIRRRREPPQPYRVSRVDRYVDCPFKYFAETVLGLPEERDEMAGLTPLERGTLVHELFERFYRAWQAAGPTARSRRRRCPTRVALFAALTREALAPLPEADRALEETRLLGSIVAPRRGRARVRARGRRRRRASCDRLLEVDLRGPFTFPQLGGLEQQTIEIRGKADRIDVFDDGSAARRRLQAGPAAGRRDRRCRSRSTRTAARQSLEARDGRPHPVASAMYLAFGDDRRLEGALGGRREPADSGRRRPRVASSPAIVERIEAGEFPPRPQRPGDCQWCRYAGVCRKEYRAERAMKQPSLFDLPVEDRRRRPPPDQAARDFAVDPANDVVLEASAGTGKTRVLVDRYVAADRAGRRSAPHPRDHVHAQGRGRDARARAGGAAPPRGRGRACTPARWRALRERIADIQISTIDAFCFGLLREFPLEADVDPGVRDRGRNGDGAVRERGDRPDAAGRARAASPTTRRAPAVRARQDARARATRSAALLDRRHVALPAVATFVRGSARPPTAADAGGRVRRARLATLHRRRSPHRAAPCSTTVRIGRAGVPVAARGSVAASDDVSGRRIPARVQQLRRRLERYFLTKAGEPRQQARQADFTASTSRRPTRKRRHEARARRRLSPGVARRRSSALDVDVNGLLARGLLRVLVDRRREVRAAARRARAARLRRHAGTSRWRCSSGRRSSRAAG